MSRQNLPRHWKLALGAALTSLTLLPLSVAAELLRLQEPRNANEGLRISQSLLSTLESCASPCEIQIGERRFAIETPALGRGERGIVYRLHGSDTGQVIKISRPDARSLEILREEALSHRFWSEHQGAFKTATRSVTHPTG